MTPEAQQQQEEAQQQQEERRQSMLAQVLQPQARERCEPPLNSCMAQHDSRSSSWCPFTLPHDRSVAFWSDVGSQLNQ